jgi:hypothetical protein
MRGLRARIRPKRIRLVPRHPDLQRLTRSEPGRETLHKGGYMPLHHPNFAPLAARSFGHPGAFARTTLGR